MIESEITNLLSIEIEVNMKTLQLSAVLFATLLTANICIIFSQAPAIEWQNTISGNFYDYLYAMQPTSDGGYIIGSTSSSSISGDKTENAIGSYDYWIIKLDSIGTIIWQNNIGGSSKDYLRSIQQTTDGGYIVGGYSESGLSGDKTEASNGLNDYWVIKLDSVGIIEWQNTIGGSNQDYLYSIRQTTDGGYILGGYSYSEISGDKTTGTIGGTGSADYWVIKLTPTGIIEWQKIIGGTSGEYLFQVEQTTDGGFILGGDSYSGISGDKTEGSLGRNDYWIIKLDSIGSIVWQNVIGGQYYDNFVALQQTSDGGYILGGYSDSGIFGDKTEMAFGGNDYWVVKIDSTGAVEWENTIAGTLSDYFRCVSQTEDGGYIVGGYSGSPVALDKTEINKGYNDYWVLKLNNIGEIEWQDVIGGSSSDYLYYVHQTEDGGFLLAGDSNSDISVDKTENTLGTTDIWVVKLEGPTCVPVAEICNAIDDDCNGIVDDSITEVITIAAGGPITFCQGGSVLLSAAYSGDTLQWKKNGTDIPGATSDNFNVTTKGNYTCTTISDCDTVESAPIFVNVLKNPNASISAGGPTVFCTGESVLLTEVAVGGCSYQWYKGATPIVGATGLTYTATTSGNYRCRVTKIATGCYKNSNAIAVSVPCKEGLTNPAEKNLEIIPNPNSGSFVISATTNLPDEYSKTARLAIYNSNGQLMHSEYISSEYGTYQNTINLNNFTTGLYFVILYNDNIYFEEKLIIVE